MKFRILNYLLTLLICGGVLFGCENNEQLVIDSAISHETDPAKIIIGRWKRTKVYDKDVTIDGKVVSIYQNVKKPSWLKFSSDSSIVREYFDENGKFYIDNGTYWIDSVIHYNSEFGINPWFYEFSDKNHSLKITNAFPAFSLVQFIYIREYWLTFKADFEADFCGARNIDAVKKLNPELLNFDTWLAQNKLAIKL